MYKKNRKIFYLTKSALKKIEKLIYKNNKNILNLRIYISGGGCSGFQYCFKIDSQKNKNDIIINNYNISILMDPISYQYLKGGTLDFIENLEGSKFIIQNPNAKTTCGCGSSFSI